MEEYVRLLSEISKRMGIPCEIKKLLDYEEAQKMENPLGTLGIYYNGIFKTHELMSERKF